MRWKALIAVAIILGGIVVAYVFLLDSLMAKAFIHSSQRAFGAKAEVDLFDFGISDLSVEIRGYRVADKDAPMQNLFEIGRIHGDLNILPLLEKKVVIDEVAVENLALGTPRATSGALKRAVEPAREKRARKWTPRVTLDIDLGAILEELPIHDLMQPDSLKSVRLAKEVRAESDTRYKKWEQKIAQLDARVELKEAEAAVEELRKIKSIERLDDLADVRAKMDRLNGSRKALEAKVDEFKAASSELRADMDYFAALPERVRAAKEEDYQRILASINLRQFNVQRLTEAIFGPVVAQRFQTARKWVGKIRRAMPERTPEEKEAERRAARRGVEVSFPKEKGYPRLLVRKISLSGEARIPGNEVFRLSGRLEGVTSDQDAYGSPTSIAVNATKTGAKGFAVSMDGTVDHRSQRNTEAFKLAVSDLSLRGLSFGKSPLLPPPFTDGEGLISLDLLFDAETYKASFDASMQGVRLAERAYDRKNELQSVLNEMYANLRMITLQGQILGTEKGTTTRLSSNLDEYFSEQILSIANRKIAEAKALLRRELDARADKAREEAEKEIAAMRSDLEARIETKRQELDLEIGKLREELTKKQQMVEDRVDAERKKVEEAATKEAEKAKEELGRKLKKLLP